MNIRAMIMGALGGAVFGLLISAWNRKQACDGTVCRLNGDPKVATLSYGLIGAFFRAPGNRSPCSTQWQESICVQVEGSLASTGFSTNSKPIIPAAPGSIEYCTNGHFGQKTEARRQKSSSKE